jgi:hypothetical protein
MGAADTRLQRRDKGLQIEHRRGTLKPQKWDKELQILEERRGTRNRRYSKRGGTKKPDTRRQKRTRNCRYSIIAGGKGTRDTRF